MINIAILGFGVVGSGTAEVISRCQSRNNHRKQENIHLKYIVDLRDFPDSPYRDKFVTDFAQILADEQLHIVVETIGGVGAAYQMTKQALEVGKSVVTSNKELVANHGAELLQIAKENNCNYLFEAAVGGGIPILRPLTTCLMGNNITEIIGILNGTTNFILSKMFGNDKLSYEEALTEAQKLGYAEQDPSADVEGKDAGRKISILGNIAFGGVINPNQVPTEGITHIAPEDVAFAVHHNWAIKLLGRTFQNKEGKTFAYVSPHIVTDNHPLKNVNDAFNMVEVTCDSLGKCHFFGQGAGDLPTASAVVGDILDLAKDLHRFRNNGWSDTPIPLGDIATVPLDYYVRLTGDYETLRELCEGMAYCFVLTNSEIDAENMNDSDYFTMNFVDTSIKEIWDKIGQENILNIIPML